MKKLFWIPIAAIVALLAGVVFTEKGSLLAMLGATPFAIVAGCTFLACVASHGFGGFGRAFTVASRAAGNRAELGDAKALFLAMQRALFASGGAGFILGAILVLSQLSTVERLGAGLAICLLCFLYALLGELLIVVPMRGRIERALAALEE